MESVSLLCCYQIIWKLASLCPCYFLDSIFCVWLEHSYPLSHCCVSYALIIWEIISMLLNFVFVVKSEKYNDSDFILCSSCYCKNLKKQIYFRPYIVRIEICILFVNIIKHCFYLLLLIINLIGYYDVLFRNVSYFITPNEDETKQTTKLAEGYV